MQRYNIVFTVILVVFQTVLSSEHNRSSATTRHIYSRRSVLHDGIVWKHKISEIANFLKMIEEPCLYRREAEFDITCEAIRLLQEEHREKFAKLSSGAVDKMIMVTWLSSRRKLLGIAEQYNYQSSKSLSRLLASDCLGFKICVGIQSNRPVELQGYTLPLALQGLKKK